MHSFEIKPHNGAMTLFVDEQPNIGLMYGPMSGGEYHFKEVEDGSRSFIRDFADAGVHIYNDGPVPVYRDDISGEFDLAAIDASAHGVLARDPNGLMMPLVFVSPPPGWLARHPEERLTYHDGRTSVDGVWPREEEGSWTSEIWREAAAQELARYVSYVEDQPYGEHMLGYYVNHGVSGEWVHSGGGTGFLADYSRANVAAFRGWLRERYGTVEALREAWSDVNVDFCSATIPTAEQRRGDSISVLRDPVRDRQVIDFYLFHAHSVADTLCYFARAAKEVCHRRKLVACFYGYLCGLSWHPGYALESGHFALRQVLDSPDIDFLSAPCSYSHRASRSGVSAFPGVLGSVAYAGKMWLDENDLRTHHTSHYGFGWTDNAQHTIQVQRRHSGNVLANGTASWWFDMVGGWYADSPTMTEIANLTRIAKGLLNFDRTSQAEIAFVVDEESMAFTESNNNVSWCFLEGMSVELARIGAPVETILLSDLPKATGFKLYIFPNAYELDDKRRQMIGDIVKRDGKTALWMYAPGYIRDSSASVMKGIAPQPLSTINMCDFVGLDICQAEGHYSLTARTVPGKLGAPGELSYGSDRRICPVFWVQDKDSETLAISEDFGRPVLSRKLMGDWTSVYSMCGPLSASVLREIARDAGVHIWWEGEGAFYANRSFFACHARNAGVHTVSLPRATDVYDLCNTKTVATDAREVKLELQAGETCLCLLAGEHEWNSTNEQAGMKGISWGT